ncbi:LytTR family DNA-binding domain-containing protein [Lewinella sp. W8]|uniref:LytR/AlgR family response regulator transcription factor n=1 Tax=Lewinella sp. W8 TaxID=2528208 RepID=UPI00106729D7|nr:response regulator [Lewinella sp. W8]
MKTSTYSYLKVLVLEQDEALLQLLKILLQEIGISQVVTTKEPQDAFKAYRSLQPDICILNADLKNQGRQGPNLAAKVQRMKCKTSFIFLVSNFEYEAYQKLKTVSSSSVITKELSKLKLLQAIDHAVLQLENSTLSQQRAGLQALQSVAQDQVKNNEDQLFFRIGDSFRSINKSEIKFFYADNKLTYARVGKRNFPTNVQLKTLEETLNPTFLRCHKKYIVNVSFIESIRIKQGKVKVDNELLSIGYSYRKQFLNQLNLLK